MKLTQEIINQAMQAFGAGEFSRVISTLSPVYEQHPMAKMVYATALGKVAEFTTSFEIFESLQSDYPQNTDVAYNYGLLLKEAERFDDAQKQLSKAIAINPNYHVAFHALGNLMSELGRNEEAQLAYEKAIAKNPKNIQYGQSLSKCLYQQEKWSQLVAHIKREDLHLSDKLSAELYTEACYRIHSRGELAKQSNMLSSTYSDSYSIHYFLALSALESKRYVHAKRHLEKSLSLADSSDKEELLTYLDYVSWLLNATKDNLDVLNRKFENTDNIQLLELAFNINENRRELAEAEKFLGKIQLIQAEGDKEQHELKRSLLAFAKGEFEEGLRINEHFLVKQPKSLPHLYQKIRTLEKLKRFSDAEEVIRFIAHNVNNLHSSKFADLSSGVMLNGFDVSPSPIVNASSNSTNILFIVGFPRSGTTLIESLLLKNANVELLEETDAVETFYNQMVERDIVDPETGGIKSTNQSELDALANDYLEHLTAYSPSVDSNKLIVDKMPLNFPYLPAMLTLFPNAKVLCCLRNPKAVALSCLQFEEINLYTVEQFAEAYNKVFTCWEKMEPILRDRAISIKYEDVVADPESSIASIYQFSGLTEGEAKTLESNSSPLFQTPSYYQVSQPVYKSSMQKYENYPTLFSACPPLLDEWEQKWGY